jgi:propionate CoA-transferase
VDVERDVMAQMGFRPIISAQLREMDGRIFREALMGLGADLARQPARYRNDRIAQWMASRS